MLTAAGTLIVAPQADAATMFYWQDADPGYYRPAPVAQPRKPKARRPSAKTEAAIKETNAKPHGPLIIAVSIEQQKVRVYDANGLFAESPVSTGMKGHSTPMGVFSIIQKHKMHRSNIYSGAPMPYMQRITWSGVAMHAGVLPGYPASHGCIRMPMAFAMKMWNWTRMGARVIVTPGQITPASFTHPLLVAQKVVPQPLIANDPATDAPAVKSDKGADAGHATKPASSEASLDLRSTVGHAAPLRERTHTADASSALPAINAVVTMSDATPSAARVPPASDTSSAETKPDAPKSEPAAEAAAADVKSAETGAVTADDKKVEEASAPEPSAGEVTKAEVSASESVKAEDKSGEAKVEASSETKSDEVNAEAPTAAIAKVEEAKTPEAKTPESKAAEKPAEPVKAVAGAPAGAAAPDVKKDAARLPGAEKAARADPPRRPGQIAVFVSRKDSKLYVRENFKPQFDAPITIAPNDRPLGTHVFTAEADKNDPNLLRWTVVSLPVTARHAARTDEEDRTARRRKMTGGAAAEAKPLPAPNSPAEALDRIAIAPEAMARIAEILTTGSSIVVSDHGINQGGETGEGTDFIVPLR
ncbi:L,D-transpeptidase [Bradyrhizobium sp. AUGA SZCCT0283]|uniref:L,D-transpeptidase n=1 Tax=Bradyrhizobium sp. AUGA SZCCT0283 TaxID=2807671 RepID=UPI0020112CE1|nr:L,D-transpeptidase [Bradyrhizobium sp. AUGA SZCCT0283]